MSQKTIVIGVIGSDCHAVGIKILENCLSEDGFKIINIGVMSPQKEFINAAKETAADAIVVSSLYGHGEIDCRGIREKCKEAGLGKILLYIGGNIVVGKQKWEDVENRFNEMGFNRVYPPGATPSELIHDLNKDLPINSRS